MDAKFFRKAKKVNRAVEITDNEAVIPAVKDAPEIRVPLPNRRLKTFEERDSEIQSRYAEIEGLEEQIEAEKKTLLALIKEFKSIGSGAAPVVVQNLKIKTLMEKRSSLARPERWIESLKGLTFVDIFDSKRDTRKIGDDVFQVKTRVEPITSLYVDLGAAAAAAAVDAEAKEQENAAAAAAAAAADKAMKTAKTVKAAALPSTDAAAAAATAKTGAIIGQKRTIKVKGGPSATGAPKP
jgi:hypothetical protein